MRRATGSPPTDALRSLEAMMRAAGGLRLLLACLPPGATLADARRMREAILQRGRRRCALLDREHGIRRG